MTALMVSKTGTLVVWNGFRQLFVQHPHDVPDCFKNRELVSFGTGAVMPDHKYQTNSKVKNACHNEAAEGHDGIGMISAVAYSVLCRR
jgi:hypothetical protein